MLAVNDTILAEETPRLALLLKHFSEIPDRREPWRVACADIFNSAECTNYFAACGYDTT